MDAILETLRSDPRHWVWPLLLFLLTAKLIERCFSYWLRSRNIKAHGWPPPHCDADGDLIEEGHRKEDTRRGRLTLPAR